MENIGVTLVADLLNLSRKTSFFGVFEKEHLSLGV
jgi:hypothetical protein